MTTTLQERLTELVEPRLTQLGYELVELEFAPGRQQATLRIFIDRLGVQGPGDGVGLADCERVSHELSELLDAADPIPSAYALEVSSPGFDRRLRTRTHFERFVGARVHVELVVPRDGRRRYTGRLEAVDEAGIRLEVDRQRVNMSFAEIDKARLAP
ncbi:MAG: ribosome maturation factor RimP [Steroidobacteraceae bacterium]